MNNYNSFSRGPVNEVQALHVEWKMGANIVRELESGGLPGEKLSKLTRKKRNTIWLQTDPLPSYLINKYLASMLRIQCFLILPRNEEAER